MNHRFLISVGVSALAVAFAVVLLAPSPAAAQQVLKAGPKAVAVANNANGPAKPYVVPKTPDGQPDLQGYWTNNTYHASGAAEWCNQGVLHERGIS